MNVLFHTKVAYIRILVSFKNVQSDFVNYSFQKTL